MYRKPDCSCTICFWKDSFPEQHCSKMSLNLNSLFSRRMKSSQMVNCSPEEWKEIKCSAFYSGFSIWFLTLTPWGHGDLCLKMNVFNFLLSTLSFFWKKFFFFGGGKWLKFSPALTPPVTSLLCWSSLNSIDKSGKPCLSVESFSREGWVTAISFFFFFFFFLYLFFFWSTVRGRSEWSRNTKGAADWVGGGKNSFRGRQRQMGLTKTRIISHLQDIKCYTCLGCGVLCVIILSDTLDDVFHLNPNHTFVAVYILPALWYFLAACISFLSAAGYEKFDV